MACTCVGCTSARITIIKEMSTASQPLHALLGDNEETLSSVTKVDYNCVI